ncbi:MAG: type II CRISPR RNA-guided endonuclease Cas9, partial [Oscillospiraceae bacterium]|nr:type II CRISPR RNA-guided endonuclease Cas9 [Oscillospiraceae bacterium]
AYLAILLSQRSFDEGPGGDSPYGGNQIEKMVGKCTFLPDQPRAAKATYSFEYFTLLERINHIRIQCNGESLPLTAEQREALITLVHDTESLDYSRIRKALEIPEGARFNTVRYEGDAAKCEKKTKFQCLTAFHTMRKAFDKIAKGYINGVSVAQRNVIATALTYYRTSEKLRAYLVSNGIPEELIAAAEDMKNFTKFGHISVMACDAIIPYLEKGMVYSEACTAAGYNFRGHEAERTMLLHPTEEDYQDLTSPVVKRAISQTIKVVNAIIRKQGGSPLFINVELAREMAKDFTERKKMEKDMLANQAANERIMERLRKEFGIASPTGMDLVKLKLYEQQGGVCAYSLTQISMARLFEPDYVEIDHIIPYSISFDDGYKNKVLVLARENRNKGNRLPLQYLQGKRREDFIVWVQGNVRDYRKRQILLKEAFTKEDESKFKERNLQDTKTASRFILNYLNDHLLFAPSQTGRKKRVTAVNGAVTDHMRKRWGIRKIRANGDLHHAVDAVVVACTTDRLIKQISTYSALRECRYVPALQESIAVDEATGEVLKTFPYPWPQFRKELEGRLSSDPKHFIQELHLPMYVSGQIPLPEKPIFVSRMPMRKVTGAAHKDTIKSPKKLVDGVVVVRRPIQALKLKDGEIADYLPSARAGDPVLYNALLEQLKRFGGDGTKAFAEPFHRPQPDGTPGPVVKKVQLVEKSTLNVPVHQGRGVADNDSMVRVDVFYVEDDGYYLVPIYVADTKKPKLPNKACVAGKTYEQWKEMRKEDFLFSLYPNDLIRISGNKPQVFKKSRPESDLPDTWEGYSMLVYFRGMNIATASIKCTSHDAAYEKEGIGVKTLLSIEKFSVDILGEYHKVTSEKRQPFCSK